METLRKGDRTRRKLLEVAFEVIRRKGFQAAGLGEILAAAGLTKGALYYHFHDKTALGYAIVEEIVGEIITKRWIEPLSGEGDPLTVMIEAMRETAEKLKDRDIRLGCPLGNLAAEMSALDQGFAERIGVIYRKWRETLGGLLLVAEQEFEDPGRVAEFIVSSLSGSLARAKLTGSRDVLNVGIAELEFYLRQRRSAEAETPESQYAPSTGGEIEDYLL